MDLLRAPRLEALLPPGQPVLLVNAPAVDLRLPWARWQQPLGLLQIGAALKARGCQVRLVDCLQWPGEGRLPRALAGRLEAEGQSLDLWRLGLSPAAVAARVRAWGREGWHPQAILVSCALSTWWQGTRDLIAAVRRVTTAPVVLGGAYPTFYLEHAGDQSRADVIVMGDIPEAQEATADLTLYSPSAIPRFAALRLGGGSGPWALPGDARPPGEVAKEVEAKAALGVTTFALFDDLLGPEHHEPLARALEAVAALGLRGVRFVMPGNLSPRGVDGDLGRLLWQAGFRQIHLHDDLALAAGVGVPAVVERLSTEEDYARCVRALHRAGFRPRTDEVGAGVVVGFPGEDLAAATERLVRLASVVGSVNLVPFQYTPGTQEATAVDPWLARRNGHLEPAALNAQLYPLACLAGASLEEYRELTRLAALLNSKYHSTSFDFLGDAMAARLLRTSLRAGRWNPVGDSARGEAAAAGATRRGEP